MAKGLQKVFLWPDTHNPFHDKRAVSVALKALAKFKPDVLVLLGDIMDTYSLSRHEKLPTRSVKYIDELNSTKELLKKITKAAPKARKIFLCGNHEKRLLSYLAQKAPELYESFSIESELGLDELGFEYCPYGDHMFIGKLVVTHDVGHCGINAHKQSLSATGMSVAIGHTHRQSMVIEHTLGTGELITGAMCGWLGSNEAMSEYVPQSKIQRFAIHGFAVAHLFPDGTPVISLVPIIKGKCILNGEIIK